MIELIATAESTEQAKSLLNIGVDKLYIGNDTFGLRLPTSFSQTEIAKITDLAHQHNKQVCVAFNALMHNEQIEQAESYLKFLEETGVDSITVGDTGVIHLLQTANINLPYIYDTQTLVTNARQINFWAKRGAKGAVLARELTYAELHDISSTLTIPAEILVYGATCIHQSKRPLIDNYFDYTNQAYRSQNQNQLFISEAKKPDTHYSIYQNSHGTHIFATDDINLLPQLKKLMNIGLTTWKLDGLFTRGKKFEQIAQTFIEAKHALSHGQWSNERINELNDQIMTHHPRERSLSDGFFSKDPSEVQ